MITELTKVSPDGRSLKGRFIKEEERYCVFGCGKLLREEDGDHIESGSCAKCN